MARNVDVVAEGKTEAVAGIEEGVVGPAKGDVGRADMWEGWLGEVAE